MKDSDGRTDCIAVRFGPGQTEPNGSIAGELVVTKQECRAAVGGDQHVEIAVTIEVAVREAASNFWRRERVANLRRDILERVVPVVQEQVWGLRVADMAVDIGDRPAGVGRAARSRRR